MYQMSKEHEDQLVDAAIRGARGPMRAALGESPRGYDKADEIAEGIARGLRMGLADLGLRPKSDD